MYHQVEQNFSATAHLTQIILWYGKLYCICKMSSIQQSRLYPLDTYSTPTPDIQQWLQTLPNVSWGKNHPQLRNSGLDVAIHYGKKKSVLIYYISVFFSRWVMSDSLWHHGLRHIRLHCSPLSPGMCSNLCPLSWWCCLIISSQYITSIY